MRITILTFFILLGFRSQSQNFLSWKYADRYFTLAVGTGSVTYFGDINSTYRISAKPQLVNVGVEARLLNHFSARIEGARYTMEGDDNWARPGSFEQQRNHSFLSKNWEGNFQVIYYLRPYAGDYFRRDRWEPYLGLGVGLTSYNPSKTLNGEKYYLRNLPTEPNKEYGITALIIPVTGGVKFKINDFTNLNLELGYRYTNTDYLDDVSGVYADLSDESLTLQDLANPKDLIPTVNVDAYNLLVPGAKRGNDSNRDAYLFIMIKAEIYLPNKIFFK